MMAEHDQDNDEYRFAELDSLDDEPMGDSDVRKSNNLSSGQGQFSDKKNIKRNALIAVGLVILVMVLYKFIGYLFFSDASEPVANKAVVPPVTQVTATQPVPTTITPVPVQQIQQVQQIDSQAEKELANKVSAIEASQQSLRAEVSALSDQIGSINNNINNLNTQIANLNQVMGTLSNQLAKQSEVIGVLIARSQPKKVKPVARYVPQRIIYNIQAVIPGRAWLIGSNGSTITVREGTKIAGYGMVKLIDSIQGRVLTSSGQVIKFSQDDS
ncbi:type IVB secretion system protein IcmG/DotF [Legionella bononiensis]|uniref:Type IV secretion protein IcmG n=1 Tax=Legionella bononiensis TaxID=2793102 RepID=A0ABS1W948_9GAMM|nr:type IV secretion protein IcmG [Legionella bononiensis]MBL7525875.1 type IV secretion protein IcmG [Legionella bononiensis]MBL7562319.1 type IV secretion protein IcmG [Legionella bononiensis]